MKIQDLHCSSDGSRVRAAATITWEDCEQPRREIYFETDARFAADLHCNPNAFLLAAFAPAMRHGERRVLVEGTVCPQLRNGLITAMHLLQRWYGEARHQPVRLEATEGFHAPLPASPARMASFMSGGVDSLTTLRANRLDFPLDHPGSIQHLFFVHGFDLGGYEAHDRNLESFTRALARFLPLCEEAEATLIPVYTNLRFLEGAEASPYNNLLFSMESHGAALAAVAHVFARCSTSALIPSTDSVEGLSPRGSHPLLDPNYSSAGLRIRHEGLGLTRLQKVGLIANWESALLALRTCLDPLRPAEFINCGRCEKCLRTMLELLLFDKLNHCQTYSFDNVTPQHIESLQVSFDGKNGSALRLLTTSNVPFWREILSPLRRKERHDLVAAIEAKLAEHERFQATWRAENEQRKAGRGRMAALKRIDSKYLGGILLKMKRMIAYSPDGTGHAPH